jgi:molybdate transport system regulatory protein
MKTIKELKEKNLTVRSKIWLELDGKPFMGEGRLAILQAIGQQGSMLEAAKVTQISYRRIRGAVQDMEKSLGRVLVIVSRGGKGGGGAVITDLAKNIMNLFTKQQAGIHETVDAVFQRIFN